MALDIRAVVLAAGAGRRFGGVKPLARIDGRASVEHVLALAVAWRPIVVLGAHAGTVNDEADLSAAQVVVAEDWASGQSASLRRGVQAAGAVDGLLVFLADQPWLTPSVVDGTVRRFDPRAWDAVRPTFAGAPGHPVLLGRAILDRAADLEGDTGARTLLDGARVRTWDATGLADPTDVDTRDDLRLTPRRRDGGGAERHR